jgi:L-alanine-DL-glutamate epimerase-like enolase superfamily enzyme
MSTGPIVTDVEALILDGVTPYGEPTEDGERAGPRHLCVIRVSTDAGLVGYADVDSHPWIVKALVEAPTHIPDFCAGLRDAVVGVSVWEREEAWERMYRASWYHGRRGAAMHAISGIDIALWDIAAQAAGRPVSDLLGGARRDSVRAYASTLFRETDEEMRAAVDRYVVQGFTAIKFGWGPWGSDRQRDRERLAAAREAAGPDVRLMVDGHISGDATAVRGFVRSLAPSDPYWVEEPLPADRPAALAALGRESGLRIATGEQLGGLSEYEELLREDGVAVVQPDLSRCGGFTALRRIADLAAERGVLVNPHAWSSHLLTAATLQAAAWLEEEPMIEVNASTAPLVAGLAPLDLSLTAGRVAVPAWPGLGVAVDGRVLEERRVA